MFTSIIARIKGKRIVEKSGKFTPQIIADGEWHAIPCERNYRYSGKDNPFGLIKCGSFDEPKNSSDVKDYCAVNTLDEAAASYAKYLDYLAAQVPVPPKVHKMPRPEPLAWRRLKEKNDL